MQGLSMVNTHYSLVISRYSSLHGFFEGSTFVTMGVDPTDLFGRVTDHEGIRRYIFGDDGTGTYETVLAERVTADDGRVRAD